jgi:hypothetical protein
MVSMIVVFGTEPANNMESEKRGMRLPGNGDVGRQGVRMV